MFFAYKKLLGRTETRTRDSMYSLRHLPRRSSKNCDLQFANTDRQTDRHTDRLKENYSIDKQKRLYMNVQIKFKQKIERKHMIN